MWFSKNKRIVIVAGLALLCACTLFAKEEKYPFDQNTRDPFLPLVSKTGQLLIQKEATQGGMVLKGIIYSSRGSLAIISNEVFKKDDKINDYSIMKIGRKKVILKKGKEILVLKLEGK
ncbi:MAG: hypothetical protein WCI77_05040 [Candidatus Omnitrophota bacterium]